jgi:hypothetical protein
MALAEKIQKANLAYRNNFVCKLMQVTLDPNLSKEDIDALTLVINSSPLDLSHVPNSQLAQALREEGYDISASAVDRHRRGACSCNRLK